LQKFYAIPNTFHIQIFSVFRFCKGAEKPKQENSKTPEKPNKVQPKKSTKQDNEQPKKPTKQDNETPKKPDEPTKQDMKGMHFSI
jgi:hypothetical protein